MLELYVQPAMDDVRVLSQQAAREVFAQFARHPHDRHDVASDEVQPDTLLGTFALLVMHKFGHRGTPSAIVEDVVVSPGLQGRGLGRQMMAHAREPARQAGCYKLVLSSNQRRESAHAFYASLGFQRHGFSFLLEP